MSDQTRRIVVDCEAPFGCGSPAVGDMTEFGAVDVESLRHGGIVDTFHGHNCTRDTFERFETWLQAKGRVQFVSDNTAYDWQWINFYFWKHLGRNPFGFSARRIGDFYAGLRGNWKTANGWKHLRRTTHDHNPVNDAMGNAEALIRMEQGEK